MANAPRISRRSAAMPGWVRISLWVGGVLFVGIVVMLVLGHGPGQHMGLH